MSMVITKNYPFERKIWRPEDLLDRDILQMAHVGIVFS